MLTFGHRCSIEPEVDLTGHWIDGDIFHVGPITVGNDSTIGARTTLFPGAVVGKNADVAAGSGVVNKGEERPVLEGLTRPAKSGSARHPWPRSGLACRPGVGGVLHSVTSMLLGALPLRRWPPGAAALGYANRGGGHLHRAPGNVPALACGRRLRR